MGFAMNHRFMSVGSAMPGTVSAAGAVSGKTGARSARARRLRLVDMGSTSVLVKRVAELFTQYTGDLPLRGAGDGFDSHLGRFGAR